MEFKKCVGILFLIFYKLALTSSEPITLAIAGAGAVAATAIGIGKGFCYFKECCQQSWTSHNATGLGKCLHGNLFGQHLVECIVPKVIKEHTLDKDPKKPLVLSFHGSTGTGKNFVSGIIADHLYPKGFDSKYVHRILSSHEFPSMKKRHLDDYKEKLKRMIINGISKCKYALFIIDEVDKMPPGLLDTLKPYLDYNDKVDGYDFRKAIFILMGNNGVDEIVELSLTYFKKGLQREEITMKQMNKLLKSISYHTGGLFKSTLIDHYLVDFFVPFLPLEREHVKMCAEAEMKRRGLHGCKEKCDAIANEFEYFPNGEQIYSVSGCKNVERVIQVML